MALFGLSVSIVLGFVYWSTIAYKTAQTDDHINAEIRVLSDSYTQRGYSGLMTTLSARVQRQLPDDATIYLLTDHRFRPIVGNISGWPAMAFARDGWLDFKLDENGTNLSARARTFEVENRFNLLVGQGQKDLATLKDLVKRAVVWGLLLTLALGLIGGVMMRQILRKRLSSINQISRKIMQGDLRRRIATRDSGDEFDELANNLNSMLDQIEQGMNGVRRVSDNIAHDLKTPLARLRNRVEELKMGVSGNAENEASVEQILLESDGLLTTFNALLRIARIEYSEQHKNFKTMDVNSILLDLQELYEPVIEDKGQSLRVDTCPQLILAADRDMLFQAFTNLLDNAIKYTPAQGEISIRASKQGQAWSVEIADNGPGIPASERDKVVQRFYRMDQSRTTPGSGLGLALVYAVLKLHKLDLVFADNSPGLLVKVQYQPVIKSARRKC